MNLNKLLDGIKYELIKGSIDTCINDIVYDIDRVCVGCIYITILNNSYDYLDRAIDNGASVVIISKDIVIDRDVVVIKIDNIRSILGIMAMRLFNFPQSRLKTIAITGTKGKTTSSFMIKKIIESAGYQCGLIGTTGVYIGSKYYELKNTTPEIIDTIRYMNEMVMDGIDYVVMEVSSQALKYDRVKGILFDYGVFTNLSRDHISDSEHSSMDDYINCKKDLFRICNHGVFQIDSDYFYDMISNSDCSINTYGYNSLADLRCNRVELVNECNFLGIEMDVSGVINDKFRVSMPGKFSSYNAMLAILVTYLLGIDVKYMHYVLENFSVLGRCERIYVSDKFTLLIDYAHNGMSTMSILSTIRLYNPKRIVTIFGCGGNRSRDRRFEMGKIAGEYSDFCIITEDNNRYEDFLDIANDILVGIKQTDCKYVVIPSRKEAIRYAICNGVEGDIIMLLGKGHENYIEVKGIRYPFDERNVINDILKEEII